MSVNRRENDLTFFTFDHSRGYQRIHRDFLMNLIQRYVNYFDDNPKISYFKEIKFIAPGKYFNSFAIAGKQR